MVKASYDKNYAAELKSTIIGATTPSPVKDQKSARSHEGDKHFVCFSEASETEWLSSDKLELRKKEIDAPFEFTERTDLVSRINPFLTDRVLDSSKVLLRCGEVSKRTRLVRKSTVHWNRNMGGVTKIPHIVLLLKDASGNTLASGIGVLDAGHDVRDDDTPEFISQLVGGGGGNSDVLLFSLGKIDYRFIPINITKSRLAQVKKIETFVKDPLKNLKIDYGIYQDLD